MRRPGAAAPRAAAAEHEVGVAAARPSATKPRQQRRGRARRRSRRSRRRRRSAASSPAWQAAPKPRRGSCTTCAPRDAGDVGRAVGRAVVDDDGAPAGGNAFQHPGQGRGLVEARQDDVGGRRVSGGVWSRRLTLRSRKPAFRTSGPYETRTSPRSPRPWAGRSCTAGARLERMQQTPTSPAASSSWTTIRPSPRSSPAIWTGPGFAVDRAADGPTALRPRRRAAARPGRARPDAARHGRAGGVPPDARRRPAAGDHADRARRRGRPRSSAWRSARTTTSPSRSARANWCCGSSRCCAAPAAVPAGPAAPRPELRLRAGPRPSTRRPAAPRKDGRNSP